MTCPKKLINRKRVKCIVNDGWNKKNKKIKQKIKRNTNVGLSYDRPCNCLIECVIIFNWGGR